MRLVLNTIGVVGGLGCLVVAGVVVADPGMVEVARPLETQPYNRSVDQVLRGIRSRVKDAHYRITVTDAEDFILLEGEVDSESSRSEVLSAAQASTAKRIRDELRIRPAPSDAQIADQVRGALRQSYPQLADRVQVEVRSGVAYLSGNLRSHREVDELLATTLMVEGITDVQSEITLAGRPYTGVHRK